MTAGRDRSGRLLRGVYGMALWICPRAVRQRYGDDMHATFGELCRDARARGRLAVLALLARELADLAAAAIAARRDQPSTVSHEPFAISHAPRRSNAVSSAGFAGSAFDVDSIAA